MEESSSFTESLLPRTPCSLSFPLGDTQGSQSILTAPECFCISPHKRWSPPMLRDLVRVAGPLLLGEEACPTRNVSFGGKRKQSRDKWEQATQLPRLVAQQALGLPEGPATTHPGSGIT